MKELSVQRVPRGTRSTFKGSLRDTAAREGISVAQVRRDLNHDSAPFAATGERAGE